WRYPTTSFAIPIGFPKLPLQSGPPTSDSLPPERPSSPRWPGLWGGRVARDNGQPGGIPFDSENLTLAILNARSAWPMRVVEISKVIGSRRNSQVGVLPNDQAEPLFEGCVVRHAGGRSDRPIRSGQWSRFTLHH